MAEYKLPDPKKGAGKVLGLGLLVGLGLIFYSFILPFLLTIVWGTVQLAIGAIVAGILLYILFNPTFWKRTGIILEALGELLFRGFIEMNPFTIMQLQVDRAEKDRGKLEERVSFLKGQEDKLKTSLANEEKALKLAAEKMEITKKRVIDHPADFEAPLELESATNDWANSKDYIESVTPLYKDTQKLVSIMDMAYVKSGYALADARKRISKLRDTYETVTAGSSAVTSALKAFRGDSELNKAADMAVEALNKDISKRIGTIKNGIQLTSRIMNERDLNDAAKVSMALKEAETMDANFEVLTSVVNNPELERIPAPQTQNKWLNTLKNK